MPTLMEEIKEKVGKLSESVEEYKTAKDADKEQIGSKIESLESTVKELQSKYEKGFELPGYKEEAEKFSFHKAYQAAANGDWSNAGFEKEVSDSIAKSINVDTGSAGGFLAPTDEMDEIIDLAQAGRPILNKVGIQRMSGLGSGEITLPKITSGNTGYWGGSEDAADESNATFGQISLRPKYLRAWSTISRSILNQTSFGVEGIIRQELSRSITKALEQGLLYGSGTADSPRGVVNYSGISTVALGTNGALPVWDNIDDLYAKLEENDTADGNIAVITSVQAAKVLRQSKIKQYSGDTSGEYYLQKKSNAGISEFLGMPFYTSTLVPVDLSKGSSDNCTYIVLGDWSQMIMAMWGGLEIRMTEDASTFKKNQFIVGAFSEADVNLRREDSFAVIKDAKISA